MLIFCLSYSVCVSLSLFLTHKHKCTNTSLYNISNSTPAGFGRQAFLELRHEHGNQRVQARLVTRRCEHKVRAKMAFQLIFCRHTFTPICLSTHWHTNMLSQKEKWMFLLSFTFGGCIFPLLFQFSEKHTDSWSCCSLRKVLLGSVKFQFVE